ncbi:MAG: phosphate ABC transporter ATP-binding protein PstB [Gammaproteobacteria bacterium]|nr:phosphate ABC transporter ATP-binding protein PstB [Gammaproteobacteria bacterium]
MADGTIEVKNLNFYYGDQHVLHNINLSLKEYSLTALIGPSGSGKSTFLRVFNRIYELYPEQHASGKILLQGHDILSKNIDPVALRTRIGMVFQKPTPFPMSIFNNIAFAIKLHFKVTKSEVKQRVEEALVQAALWDEVKDKLHDAGTHLSGGQQQRLCIARTIAINPEILLLDEPTSSLDPLSTSKVQELILDLKTKYTIIMVTHNLKQAQQLSEDTIFMREGKIIEYAPTKQLFSQPQDIKTKQYIEGY